MTLLASSSGIVKSSGFSCRCDQLKILANKRKALHVTVAHQLQPSTSYLVRST
jgi:hypothetical protein